MSRMYVVQVPKFSTSLRVSHGHGQKKTLLFIQAIHWKSGSRHSEAESKRPDGLIHQTSMHHYIYLRKYEI